MSDINVNEYNNLVKLSAQMFNIAPEAVISIYWWGVLVVTILTASYLLIKHYKGYYDRLKTFIERDGNGGVPTSEIEVGELFCAVLLIGAVGFCWPVGLLGAVVVVVAVLSTRGVKFLVNLPHHIVQKILVKEHKSRMLTSPSPCVRRLAESHCKKKSSGERDVE